MYLLMLRLTWLLTSKSLSLKFFCHLLCMSCHIFNLYVTSYMFSCIFFIWWQIYAQSYNKYFHSYNTFPMTILCTLLFRKLGWDPKDGEGDLIVSLRETLLVSLVKLGHDHTISEGLRRFDTLIHDHNSSILSPGTRKV